MNGRPLPPKHGFPVRVIVPGVAGARMVKWLDRMTVQEEESNNFYQVYDYKVLPPEATDSDSANKFWEITPAVLDMPCNSIIADPRSDETIVLPNNGQVRVSGYALPCGEQGPVTKVAVSVDEGASWTEASIGDESRGGGKWSWVLWSALVKLRKGEGKRIFSRAIDAGGNTQVAHPQWNYRGVLYDGYGESRNLTVR